MDRIDELLLGTFSYDPETGVIIRRKSRKTGWKPGPAGGIESCGYVQVCFEGKFYMAHRLAWFLTFFVWPDGELDHINGIKTDNRISNLRVATRKQNVANQPARKDNALGIKGVSRLDSGRFRARITENGKSILLGIFGTTEEASEAYRKRHSKLHGEFSRG